MDMRIMLEDSPYLLSLVQMGTVLLSSSSNWTMNEWQDLAPWQEVSMTHIINLYAALALNNRPLKPLPHWFHTHLWGNNTDFHHGS